VVRFAARFAELAVRFAARVAVPAGWFAARVVLRAALCVICAADRAAFVVDLAALSAALPTLRGDVMPLISAARSAICAIPSTPAARPRPITAAPDSIISLTACADCSMTESFFPLLVDVPLVRCVVISPPKAFVRECDDRHASAGP
jgi:hypothetical protein